VLLIYKSRQKTRDYHKRQKQQCIPLKIQFILIALLNSVLIIHSASYHNIQKDKQLISNSSKEKMKTWLMERNIPFCISMLKAELHNLIKIRKSNY